MFVYVLLAEEAKIVNMVCISSFVRQKNIYVFLVLALARNKIRYGKFA